MATLRSALSRTWARLRGGELTPAKAAASVALGLAVGVTPLWGLHFWIVLGIGLVLRLDVPIAYLAANISIPPLLPFITVLEIEVGSLVRTGAFVGISRKALALHGAAAFLKDVWIGTAIVGPVFALIGGALTFTISKARRQRRGDLGEEGHDAAHRVVERYQHSALGTRMYVASKLSSDPVATALVLRAQREGGLGDVTDLGCGRGQLALLLLEDGVATRVRGFDWDDEKIADANRAAEGIDASFAKGDVRTVALEPCDAVLLVDVLHYFAPSEQRDIVLRAARAAKKFVVVRDIDPNRGWRSTVTRFQERITTGAKYNKGERVEPRSIATLQAELEAEGFSVDVSPCWGSTPFSNVLVVARRT